MEALEVSIDERTCFRVRDLQLSRQRVRSLSVNRCEVDGLRAGAHLRGDAVDRNVENERGRLTMDVTARLKRLHECRIVREMGQQAQLDLRIVRPHEQPSPTRDETTADVAAKLTSDRNVLQVWIARREPARRRDRLAE